METKDDISLKEASELTGISEHVLRRMAENKEIPYYDYFRRNGRQGPFRFSRQRLLKWKEDCTVEPMRKPKGLYV